jgi:hypothetical protein
MYIYIPRIKDHEILKWITGIYIYKMLLFKVRFADLFFSLIKQKKNHFVCALIFFINLLKTHMRGHLHMFLLYLVTLSQFIIITKIISTPPIVCIGSVCFTLAVQVLLLLDHLPLKCIHIITFTEHEVKLLLLLSDMPRMCMGRGGYIPYFPDFGAQWRWVVSFIQWVLCPQWKSP